MERELLKIMDIIERNYKYIQSLNKYELVWLVSKYKNRLEVDHYGRIRNK